jgi:hypothetical protein
MSTGYEINLMVQLEEDGDWDRLHDATEPFNHVAAGTDMNGLRDMQFETTKAEAQLQMARIHQALRHAGLDRQIVKLELVDREIMHSRSTETALIITVPDSDGRQVLVRIADKHFASGEIQVDFRSDPSETWTPSEFFDNSVEVRWHG